MQHRRQSLRRSQVVERLESRRMWAAQIVGSSTIYQTIQAAVDAAATGATINVDAGTYSERVYISKRLTLRGAQAGIDARSNTRLGAQETIVDGIALAEGTRSGGFYITANNVVLDGFTVQGETQMGDTGAGIVIAPSKSGTQILNNVVQNNVAGLFLANNSNTNPAVIQYNLFRNNNNDGGNGGRAIYTNGGISGGLLTNVLIDSNAFISNYGGLNTTRVEGAIALESRTLNSQKNVTITNNAFDGNGKAVLVYNADHIDIRNNMITYCKDQWSAALRFEGGAEYVNIIGNSVYDNTGPAIRIDEKGFNGSNNNFVINDNNFVNCSTAYTNKQAVVISALNQYDGTLNVMNNWWGHASGPSADGPGTGQALILFGNPGNFSPWATAPVGTMRLPYYGKPQSTLAAIQFEDYDHGGEGVAYHDLDVSNSGGQYRKGPNRVDIGSASDVGGGFMLSTVRAGEWLKYQIDAAESGIYNLDFRIAAAAAGGKFHVMIDGVDATGLMTIPNTGGFDKYATISKTGVSLAKGLHDVQLVIDANNASGGTANFNYMKFNLTTPTQLPATPSMLNATMTGPVAVSLAWQDNSNNETGFILERRSLPSGAWQQVTIAAADVTSFIDNTVAGGTTYSYRVRAASLSGDSGFSNEATITTPIVQEITYLSDLPFAGTPTNGWGPIERDESVGGSGVSDGQILTLNGVTYTKGLGTHATSDVSFTLGGAYSTFASDIGIDDRQLYDGTVVFQVYADGTKIYDSGIMTPASATKALSLNVAGVQTLRLRVTDAGDGIDHDHADWANARLLIASTPAPTVPSAPSGLAASAASASQINLIWNDVANETGFKIQRSTDGVNFTQIGTTSAGVTTYTDTNLLASTNYSYRVLATNAVGDSLASNVSSATTLAAPMPPLAPSGLSATAMSTSQINLIWNDVTGETAYHIERSLDGVAFAPIATIAADATTFSDSPLSASTQYHYRVFATNAVGDSLASNIASATTLTPPPIPTAPNAPSGLAATATSTSQINIIWNDVTGETAYKIERSLDGIAFTQIATTVADATTFSDTLLSSSTKYYYRVFATNLIGDSASSNIADATTLISTPISTVPAAPSGLTASAASVSQITLTWSDVANETGYKIQRSLDGVAFTQIATTGADIIGYSDTALTANTKYYYRVIANNAVGDSLASNIANATTQQLPPPPVTSLPTGWTNADIGTVGSAGYATHTNGVYTVNGSGAGFDGSADSANFASTSVKDNRTITARITSRTGTAGLMVRETNAANSRFAAILVNPDGTVTFRYRDNPGAATKTMTTTMAYTGPIWLRLQRNNKDVTAYVSTNGSTWTSLGKAVVNLPKTFSAGMVTFSKTPSLASAVFDNVSVK